MKYTQDKYFLSNLPADLYDFCNVLLVPFSRVAIQIFDLLALVPFVAVPLSELLSSSFLQFAALTQPGKFLVLFAPLIVKTNIINSKFSTVHFQKLDQNFIFYTTFQDTTMGIICLLIRSQNKLRVFYNKKSNCVLICLME